MKHTIRVFDGDTGAERYAITSVIDCTYQDRLDGAPTLRFTILYEPEFETDVNCNLHFDDERFRVKQTSKRMANGLQFLEVYAEHQSIALVDRKINRFDPRGTAQTALNEALDGTGITGTVDSSLLNVGFAYNMLDTNTRTVLLGIATAVKGELAYSGNSINIVPHRGSTVVRAFPDPSVGVVDVSVAEDGDTFSCTATLPGSATYGVGDEVSVYFGGLGVSQNKRVVGIRYNPFLDTTKTYEVGDYTPTIVEFYKKTMDTANKAKNDASSALNRANNVAKDVSENYVKKYEMNASVDTYINSEEGKASIVASLSGKYVTPEEVEGFVEEKELNAEIGAYLDMEEGTAKIIAATKGTYAKKTDLNNYVESTQLNTKISQYLNTTTGRAAITSAVSGTYVTSSDLSGYATVTALNTVKQSVSDVSSEIELSTSYSKNTIGTNVRALLLLVSNANSSSIKLKADMIEFTGTSKFLTASDLGSSGTTSIDGGRIKTGTISADRIEAKAFSTTTVYGTDAHAKDIIFTTYGDKIYIGSDATGYADYSSVSIAALQYIQFVRRSNATVFKMDLTSNTLEDCSFHPETNNGGQLGTSSYQWGKLYVKEVYINGTKLVTSGSSAITPTSIGTTSSPVKTAYIGYSSVYYLTFSDASIIPSTTSSSTTYFQLGSSSRPFNRVYANEIYIKGTKIEPSSSDEDTTDTRVSILYPQGSSSNSYYAMLNSAHCFIPSSASGFGLGSSTLPWGDCYLGSTSIRVGTATSSKIGFYGATPVARENLSLSIYSYNFKNITDSNYLYALNNLVYMLAKKGLYIIQ